jgi:UDP-N-acetylglucosamine 2-epimerase (non-hydrolysing)
METPAAVAPAAPVRYTVVTITGIRPDFIRMAEIFRRLDAHPRIRHVLVHTGQHYDALLSDVFFRDLEIRAPDHVLQAGKASADHFEQLAYLCTALPALFREHGLKPDLVMFLGDSNSAGAAFPLKKAGYRIAHVEAGMRSGDKRMLEEINRTVCDHCSDLLFVYHPDYAANLARENIGTGGGAKVHVVGNTIVEVARRFVPQIAAAGPKRRDAILLDVHRPENFMDAGRLRRILGFAARASARCGGLPVRLLRFPRLERQMAAFGLDLPADGPVAWTPLMPYRAYLEAVYHAAFLISDSGTGQEEPALLGTRVVVPRDFTERPQSYAAGCSVRLDVGGGGDGEEGGEAEARVFAWLDAANGPLTTDWLRGGCGGEGEDETTSARVVAKVVAFLDAQAQALA